MPSVLIPFPPLCLLRKQVTASVQSYFWREWRTGRAQRSCVYSNCMSVYVSRVWSSLVPFRRASPTQSRSSLPNFTVFSPLSRPLLSPLVCSPLLSSPSSCSSTYPSTLRRIFPLYSPPRFTLCTHAHTDTHARTHPHTHACTHARTYTYASTHTSKHTRTHAHTDARTRARTHTRFLRRR